AQERRALAERAMTGEEHERPATGGGDQRQRGVDHRRHVTGGRRLGEPRGEVQQALALVIERTLDRERRRLGESEPAGEMSELLAERERRRGEDPPPAGRLDQRAEPPRDVERREAP